MNILKVPPQKWCRIYGTYLEIFNPNEYGVIVTADLGGTSELKLRLTRTPMAFADPEETIMMEEVKQDGTPGR